MDTKVEKQLQYLVRETDALFADLKKYSEADLNRQPAPDSWSAIQCLHHLILAEKYSTAYCKKKLGFRPKLKKAGWQSGLRRRFVNWYLGSPLKFKAPPGLGTEYLPEHDTLENTKNEWLKARTEIKNFLQNLPAEYVNKEVYKHPAAGRMSIPDMLSFFGAHFRHHRKQAYRALEGNR